MRRLRWFFRLGVAAVARRADHCARSMGRGQMSFFLMVRESQ